MTPREIQVLDWVREFMAGSGLSPTIRMIAEHTDCHLSTAHSIIDSLVRQGALAREPGRAHGLRIAGMPDLRPVPTADLASELARRGVTLASLNNRGVPAVGRQVTCAADTCGNAVQRGHLMCRPHWFALPASLRERILRTNSARDTAGFERAVTEARDLIDSPSQRRSA